MQSRLSQYYTRAGAEDNTAAHALERQVFVATITPKRTCIAPLLPKMNYGRPAGNRYWRRASALTGVAKHRGHATILEAGGFGVGTV